MRKRRFVIGLGTIVLGGSGFIASGAVDVDSIGSSGGQGWVSLDDPDIEEAEDVEDLEEDADDDAPDDHDPEGEVRVQTIVDPQGGGANRANRLADPPRVVRSDFVGGDEEGFLDRLNFERMNVGAETHIGRLDGDGVRPGDQEVGFFIANVGGVGQTGVNGQAVDLSVHLFVDPDQAPVNPDGLRFPWSIDRGTAGDDLIDEQVRLGPRETLGVSIVLDGSEVDRVVENISLIGMSVSRIERG